MKPHEPFRRYLVENGLKVTPERLTIADAILGAPGHRDVGGLLLRLRRRHIGVSRATLYRTLSHLIEAGLVHRVTASDGTPRYESMLGRRHHDHMVCRGCGSMLEFRSERIEELLAAACRRRGFRMEGHTLRLEGRCRDCRGEAD